MSTVEIALASEDSYFCGMLVTVASIARHANKDCFLSFTILDAGISEENYSALLRIVERLHDKVSFRRAKITEREFDGCPAWHGNKAAYARLLLPKILPETVGHVIYCDVDFLWMIDIEELWNLRDETTPFISAKDINDDVKAGECAWCASKGFSIDKDKYFCSGLSFFNLDIFRKENLSQKTISFILENADIRSPDQTALNVVLNGRHRLVAQKWQLFSRDSPVKDIKPPCALHYAGDPPWKISLRSFMLTDVQLLWFRFDASIRKISVWQSLRQHYGAVRIVISRMIFLAVMGAPPLRVLFNAFLRATGRWGFNENMPKAQFKSVMKFLAF